jgi:uncharacterized BrkB/YihY/UPF0761 family membrane protein
VLWSRASDIGARLLAWVDALQRRKGFLGFPYAVVKKYVEDAAGREAALITYYGFLSIFPLLLVIVSVLSNVLVTRPGLRQELIEEVVPPLLQETVDDAVTAMPSSGLPFVIGLIGLLFAGTGVVLSAYRALNHLAGVPMRERYGVVQRYARVLVMVLVVLAGGLAAGALALASGLLPDITGLQQFAAALGTAVVVFVMLTIAGKLLIARPVPLRATWPAAALGAVLVSAVLALGTRLLGVLVTRSGPVYGSFATVVGVFTLFYLISQALLYAAEMAVVRQARLWPRALDTMNPTPADVRALTRLAVEQVRFPEQQIEVRFLAADPPREGPPAGG